jgi:hypothetical protein
MTFLRLVWILDKTHRKRGKVMLQFQLRINWFPGDASIDVKSDDNDGIRIHSEGGGLMTSGTIGFLQSKFNFIDCQAGPAAPLPWQ